MSITKKALFLTSTLLVIGCSGVSKKQNANNAEQEVKKEAISFEEYFKETDKKLASLAEEAKKLGPDSVEYLSSDLFIKATDASMRGDSQTAAFLYRHLLTLKPNDLYVKRKFALELIRSGNLADAKNVLEQLYSAESKKDETIGLVLGGVYTALELKDKARQIYSKVLQQHPRSEEACIFLAKSLGIDKKFQEADTLLNSCAAKNPKNPIFSYYQGKLSVHRERMTEAVQHFDRALKIDPTYYQAAIAKGMVFEESDKDETDQQKGLKKAIGVYRQFVAKNPNNYPVLTRLVQAMFATENFKEVLPYAEALSNIDPSDLNLKVRLGILYTDRRKFESAISVFKDILVAVPDSDKVLYYLGALYQQTDKFEAAIEHFSKIPSNSNLYHDGSLQIAQMLMVEAKKGMQRGEVKGIEKFTSFIDEKSAENPKLRLEMQVILTSFYESFSKYAEAITALNSVREIEGYNEGHDYYLASLYEKQNDHQSARKLIREILKKNPKNAHALNFLAYSLIEKEENLDEAYSMVKEAVAIKPDDGYIRDSLGWYYYKVGKYQKALKEIQKAKELTKDDVVITKHLAVVYKALKKYDHAKKLLVEALNYCKIESERDDVLKAIDELESLRLPASQP